MRHTIKPIIVLAGLALCGCKSYPVNSPCGVIIDSLKTVKATTTDGQRRLADHFERGVAAGCWTRDQAATATAYIRSHAAR